MYYPEKFHRIYPIIYKNRFYNYEGESKTEFLFHTLKMLCQSKYYRYKNKSIVDVSQWHQESQPVQRSEDLIITWIGHSTLLIQIAGVNIITDPIFKGASLLYPRILPPGVALSNLPPLDFVLLSHNHRDHMDASTLYKLQSHQGLTFLVPQGDKKWFRKHGFNNVNENMWWDKKIYTSAYNDDGKARIEFTFVPAYHWSQRGIFDYNKSLWGGWIIKCKDTVIFFGGDTAYSHHFKSIGEEFPQIDCAILPIGPCEPRGSMIASHLNSEDAGQAFLDVKARHFIPMHWGTFYFGLDEYSTPIDRLHAWWNKQKFDNSYNLHAVKAGESINLGSLVKRSKEEPLITRPSQIYI